MSEAPGRPKTVLSLRRIGNSQGVVLPKTLLEDLDFSRGVEVVKEADGLHLKPVRDDDDPFGFGAAARKMIAEGRQDPLLIPDVLPEDADNIDW
jgi:antitoxin component of MazEF toxin-antitoxin module